MYFFAAKNKPARATVIIAVLVILAVNAAIVSITVGFVTTVVNAISTASAAVPNDLLHQQNILHHK